MNITPGNIGQEKLQIKTSLHGNASSFAARANSRKSMPAGMPTSFISNVTSRNIFSKVLTKPTDISDNERYSLHRDVSGSNSPETRGGAIIDESSPSKTTIQHKAPTRAPFNRFASDKDLLTRSM